MPSVVLSPLWRCCTSAPGCSWHVLPPSGGKGSFACTRVQEVRTSRHGWESGMHVHAFSGEDGKNNVTMNALVQRFLARWGGTPVDRTSHVPHMKTVCRWARPVALLLKPNSHAMWTSKPQCCVPLPTGSTSTTTATATATATTTANRPGLLLVHTT